MTKGTTTYIDGFVASVPDNRRDAYLAHCETCSTVFIDHGALRVVDGWGEDVPHGKLTDFHRAVKAEPGETVVFGWIEWPSKEARMAGMARAMEDSRMTPETNPMPFDGKPMIYGGFAMFHDGRA